MTRVPSWVAAAAATIATCGCASSPPMRYYTLSEITPSGRLTAPSLQVPVRLDRVTIPSELDRSQIVRRTDATRLQLVEGHRWAAPLDDMIRRVLSADLAARLPPNQVADPNEPVLGEPRQSLAVDVQDFYGDANCSVTLRAAWTLKQPDMQSSRGSEEVHVPATEGCSGAGSLPPVMSQALAQLSDRVAAAIVGSAGATTR